MFPIPNIWFVITIAILTGYLTFLTAKGGLTNNKFSKIWRKITQRGWLVIMVLFMILLTLVLQEWNNQILSSKNEREIKLDASRRDSIIADGIRKGVDSSSNKLFNDITIAFKRQGFRLDTLRKEIISVRDSIKSTSIDVNYNDPSLVILRNGIKLRDSIGPLNKYELTVTSRDAGSTNFKIDVYCFYQYLDAQIFYVGKINVFPKNLKLFSNGEWNTRVNFASNEKISDYLLYFVGSYTTIDGSKEFKIGDLYSYNRKVMVTSMLFDSLRLKVELLIPK